MTIAAVSWRGNAVENTHHAHVAVVDAAGRLLYRYGDPQRPTLPRSAIKPAQALTALESGAFERFGLDDADLALACASHSSEPRHLERAARMLAASGSTEADLRCGGHEPLSDAVMYDWIRRGAMPTPICSNCSGKHAALLAASRALGLPAADYHRPDGALQQRVKRTVAELAGLPEAAVGWALDGCNLPTPSLPLDCLARVFAQLASADEATPRGRALRRVYRAMAAHPDLVAGTGRFCTALIGAFDGTLIGKAGAAACYGLAYPARGLGVAVKIEDGSVEALYAVVVELLHQLEFGTPAMRARLDSWRAPTIVNTVGVETGRWEVVMRLEPVVEPPAAAGT